MGPVDPGQQLGIYLVGGGEHDMVGPSARIRLAFHGDPGRIDGLRQAQGQRRVNDTHPNISRSKKDTCVFATRTSISGYRHTSSFFKASYSPHATGSPAKKSSSVAIYLRLCS